MLSVRDTASASRPTCCRTCSICSPGRQQPRPRARRPGHRPHAGAPLVELHGGIDRGAQRRARPGQRVLDRAARLLAQAPSRPARRNSEPAPRHHHRVLVVEDNDDARELMGDGARAPTDTMCAPRPTARPACAALARAAPRRGASSTSACPGSTATRWRAACASALGDEHCWSRSPATAAPRIAERSAGAGFDLHFTKPVERGRLRQLLGDGPEELARRRRRGELSTLDQGMPARPPASALRSS